MPSPRAQMPRENGACSNTVTFSPGARSAWHRHEWGQMLYGLAGNGLVVTRSGEVTRIYDGVVVHACPKEEHWHGAMPDSFMTHLSCELGGETEIYDEVTRSDADDLHQTCLNPANRRSSSGTVNCVTASGRGPVGFRARRRRTG